MSHKYAIVADDELSVIEWRTYPQALDLDTVKRLENGRLKIRPVVETPVEALPTQDREQIITINDAEVAITYVVTDKPAEVVTAERVARIDEDIRALERRAVEQGLLRAVMDDLLLRFRTEAGNLGITEAQLLNPQHPAHSPAYAKVHANEAARAALRARR